VEVDCKDTYYESDLCFTFVLKNQCGKSIYFPTDVDSSRIAPTLLYYGENGKSRSELVDLRLIRVEPNDSKVFNFTIVKGDRLHEFDKIKMQFHYYPKPSDKFEGKEVFNVELELGDAGQFRGSHKITFN
jgi:hypothetical protein